MKKQISCSGKGNPENIGNFRISRILPNRYVDAVGSFVFLDHLLPQHRPAEESKGVGAHPHRGIATLTYLLSGKAQHYDSMGHKGSVTSGGAQWMKAGKGVMHDEVLISEEGETHALIHGFQFWINLPPAQKIEDPEYLSLNAADMPLFSIGDHGFIKVVVGSYEGAASPVPVYKEQFLYHLHLPSGAAFRHNLDKGTESAVFVATGSVLVNDMLFQNGEFIELDREEGIVELRNEGHDASDVLFFGGETYTDPMVADGPFVMNSRDEIRMAYRDFMGGKYGRVTY